MWLRPVLLLVAVLPAAAQTAGWREAALARIEQIRKDTLTVRVVHGDGKPAAGVTVKATLLEHEFGFGAAVAAGELSGGGEDSERYRTFIRNNFNMAVLENDLKWPQWDRDRQPALDAVAWLRANGISRVRGHTLVWPGWRWLPSFLKPLAADPAALRERVRAHIEDIVTANRGALVHWDVLNEPFTNHDLMDLLGNPVMAEWFREARRRDPEALLFINDYNILSAGGQNAGHQDHYHSTIRLLLDQGAPLGGIGLQGHFTQTTPPERMLAILDRFGEFGLPIAITEFDYQTKDEAAQAAFFRDFLTVCFSHPRVRWFLMWGFWEGRHWRPDGAMVRRDWSPKPAYEVWRDLVLQQWWTRAEAVTGETGQVTFRGFHGRYGVTAFGPRMRASAPVVLPAGGAAVTLTLP
jgi:GH35 family endo-1,4-beta-xylanase